VHESEDGRIELWYGHESLPYSIFESRRLVHQGDVVKSKSLDAVLSVIKHVQQERAQEELASGKLTRRERERLETRLESAGPTYDLLAPEAVEAVSSSMRRIWDAQRERTRKHNLLAAERRKAKAILPG